MYEHITDPELKRLLLRHHELHQWLDRLPYSPQLYVEISDIYAKLGYPDLAVGAAYKALLLTDAIEDDTDEYHEETLTDTVASTAQIPAEVIPSLQPPSVASFAALSLHDHVSADEPAEGLSDEHADILVWAGEVLRPLLHRILARNLLHCGCYRSAHQQCKQGLQRLPGDEELSDIRKSILHSVEDHYGRSGDAPPERLEDEQEDWPDSGLIRRECYPWNDLEPDRFSMESLEFVNAEMEKCAPKLEVKAVELPALTADSTESISKQLGVFAREDLFPGEVILDETSLLTANNRLQDTLCDACGVDIESSGKSQSTSCEECYTLFCSPTCHFSAQSLYHPSVCDKDTDSIARDVPPAQAADSLYLLLLLRSLAMSDTQSLHPLSLKETKFIWGDYHSTPLINWSPPTPASPFASLPRTLPFNLSLSVILPFHLLTKMDINIFTSFRTYDVWIFNTLYAKFRGTASARFTPRTSQGGGLKLGRAMQGPEVSAVHPNWCLANHSCDPNVEWEWGGRVQFRVRGERREWIRGEERRGRKEAGIRKGEEVLSHYCDVGLGVRQRREWAVGALGGECRCERCVWEAGEGEE
ncbi:hypothetical protein KVT40_004802 [Elsinoe batatas]|uniref:SET domain-containing protein n=1 Tax=Elsinoe batatas TaxID=2601811 RepID=A0A8K0L0A8_9PEZI|nr:hypothetical protein KVT40_004802 [Elsinoe batatas]